MEIDFKEIALAMQAAGYKHDSDHLQGYSDTLLDVMEELYGLEHEVTNELEELENERSTDNQ